MVLSSISGSHKLVYSLLLVRMRFFCFLISLPSEENKGLAAEAYLLGSFKPGKGTRSYSGQPSMEYCEDEKKLHM